MGGRKPKDEKDLEKLAKKLLSMPHKPREGLAIGKRRGATKTEKAPRRRKRDAKSS